MDTSSVTNMQSLFSSCIKLKSLDLTNFNTSSVQSMDYMFYNCNNLKYLKFSSSFNTSNVKSMNSMFYFCRSLMHLNLSSFDVSQVTNMNYMFYNCYNLKYLDISHFSPKNLFDMKYMFCKLPSLIYLNIDSLEINDNTNKDFAFDNFPQDLKICSSQIKMKNYLTSINKNVDCSDICFIKNIKIDINSNECIHSCSENGYNHECNNICYNECPENTHYKIKNLNNKDNIFSEYEDGVAICLEPNTEGYFLDEYEFYEECFQNCKFCYGKGNESNNNCKKCKYNFFFLDDIDDIKFKNNCYEKCQYYYYINESMEYTCTLNENCPEYFNKLIPEKSKCIDNCKNDNIYKYEYNNTCYEKCPGDTIASFENEYLCLEDNIINDYKNISINEYVLQNMKEYLLNDYNKTKSGNDIEIETKNLLITITNAFNQKNNIYKNKTTIDLGDCEKELIKYYNISENESLYILKMDFKEEGMKIPKIEYEVYYPLNDIHLFILNLTICKNIRIDISIPIDINDNDIDKYNPDSDYYNDICSKTTSDSGTDISLTDRKIKFIDDNMTLCEEDCKLIHYHKYF